MRMGASRTASSTPTPDPGLSDFCLLPALSAFRIRLPNMPQPDTPAALGYRMPAEWDRHDATWIAWPHHREDWPGKFGPIPWVYTEIVRHPTRGEAGNILAGDKRPRREAA